MGIEDIRRVGVVGAGTMGSQIAHVVALAGYPVRLYSRTRERLDQSVPTAQQMLRKRVEKGKLDGDECEAALARVTVTTQLAEAVGDADLVIKSVAEDRDVKHQVFRLIDRHAPRHAILASNSSTMATSFFEDCVTDPSRLLNIHFFNPALMMQLVEVVRGEHTSDATVDRAMEFSRSLGKTPVLVRKESYGFIVNRILFIAMQEAFKLVEAGVVSKEDADLAVKNGLNWPMGPFELADLVGLDVTTDILEQGAEQTHDERWRPTPILRDLVAAGRLGRKTGRGFFDYSND
jgi:3-hydroxybutyryl-CoA dehydrogenase